MNKTKYFYELARETLNHELDGFDNSPEKYICSIGWQAAEYPFIGSMRGLITPTVEDYKNLASIMESRSLTEEAQNYEGADLTLYILESGSVSDFLSNYVAGQILTFVY
jgi:hypothetical protein